MPCVHFSKTITDKSKKLLKYVAKNDLKKIKKIIESEKDLLLYEYDNPYEHHTIFTIACNDRNEMANVNAATIEELISLGASCTQPSKNDFWEAIHYTALNANKEKMGVILKYLNLEELNSLVYCSKHIQQKYDFCSELKLEKTYSNNALSILLKYGNQKKDFYECCTLLIMAGINVDQKDSKGVSSLDLIRDSKDENLIKILQLKNDDFKITPKISFEFIKVNDEAKFLTLKLTQDECNDFDGEDEAKSSCTLLQLCCTKKLTSCVEYLLKTGADPNKTLIKNINCPIMIAIKEDCEEIFNLLLKNTKLKLPEDILIKLQLKYKHYSNFAKVDKYMELILKYLSKLGKESYKKYLLVKDELNRTPLHYATHYRCSENIFRLLCMGALSTVKDRFGYTPLDSIDPPVLEKFFDNCINLPKSGEEMDNMMYFLRNKKEKFAIEINYEALIVESEIEEIQESEFLEYLIKIKSLTYLINHPVISCYLAVKWQNFKWFVYVNLFLYILAYISLLFYGFSYTTLSVASNSLLLSSLVLILMQEFIQAGAFRLDYIKRTENQIDLLLIAGIIYLLSSGWYEILNNQNILVAFSVVFLTSTLGIFIHLGNLSIFTVKVLILKQITLNFLKFAVFYMFPILAFFFCFYMLDESKDDVFFQTLYDVITMYAGDPKAEYPEKFTTNPIFGHIIYVIFIIFIGIILQNLLIGLAVSDLQEIQKEAEFIDKKERAKYITNIERIISQKYKQAGTAISKSLFRKVLRTWKVFQKERVLVIQPYNSGCVFLKEVQKKKQYINDQNIVDHLQNLFKELTMNRSKDEDEPYSLKVLHDRLDRIEALLKKLNIPAASD